MTFYWSQVDYVINMVFFFFDYHSMKSDVPLTSQHFRILSEKMSIPKYFTF